MTLEVDMSFLLNRVSERLMAVLWSSMSHHQLTSITYVELHYLSWLHDSMSSNLGWDVNLVAWNSK